MGHPLQNRVDPWGVIHAVPQRGTMMGNRGGKFHRPDQTLGKRRWASRHWICCDIHYKGMKHEAMGLGYTSLFFLDEVTALAAGHRPCFFCRRAEAKLFMGNNKVVPFDHALHEERLAPRQTVDPASLPDGAMVDFEGIAYARRGSGLLRWSFDGYRERMPRAHFRTAELLTPPAIIAILARGYTPRWHESAQDGELT